MQASTSAQTNRGKLGTRTESGCCSECGWASFSYPGYSTEGVRGYRCNNPQCGAIKPEAKGAITGRMYCDGCGRAVKIAGLCVACASKPRKGA